MWKHILLAYHVSEMSVSNNAIEKYLSNKGNNLEVKPVLFENEHIKSCEHREHGS